MFIENCQSSRGLADGDKFLCSLEVIGDLAICPIAISRGLDELSVLEDCSY